MRAGKINKFPILIVDDDIWMARLILQRLSGKNYNIESVAGGREAVKWIEKHPASIILIDYQLADMNADEVINRVDTEKNLVEFVVMTSIEEIKIAVVMMQLGAFDYIIKNYEFLATLPAVVKKVTEHLAIRAQLKVSNAQLQELSSHLQVSQEKERYRIASDVHDELGQSLTAIKLDLSWLKREIQPELHEMLAGTIELTDRTIDSVRRITSQLRPRILDHLGLAAAIEMHAKELITHFNIVARFNNQLENFNLPEEQSIAFYRIMQESLNNVTKHSGAKSVTIDLLLRNDGLEMQIADDGRGVTDEELNNYNSMGIVGMLERLRPWNGTVSVSNRPEGGTLVSARLPLGGMVETV